MYYVIVIPPRSISAVSVVKEVDTLINTKELVGESTHMSRYHRRDIKIYQVHSKWKKLVLLLYIYMCYTPRSSSLFAV